MSGEMMPNWLYKRAFLSPERIALEYGEVKISFKELHKRSLALAGKLASLQIKQGDFVAFLLKNGIHTVELIHALEYIGAVIVPLNNRLAPAELRFQLEDSNTTLLIYDESFSSKAIEAAEPLESVKAMAIHELGRLAESDFQPKTEINLDSDHTIMYTSGTTGSPKGVMLTYGNHWWSAIGSALNLGLQESDKWLCTVPMFHMSGLSILMRSVIYGIPVVIHDAFDPEKANEAIHSNGVTIVSVVSAMLARMVHALENNYPKSFRCMLLGGGPAPKPLLEACTEKNIPVFQTYGMTETASQIVTLSSEYMLTKIGSAGKPLFHAQLKIEKDGAIAEPHEVGEIVVKGANVTKGYLRRKQATEKAIRNGWLYTGDLGYLDEDGFLYVVDRRSDLIISGGENVYPAEIEATLLSHPSVVEAGVTGREDERWGQVPIAFVVKHDKSVDEEQLQTFCREKLAGYKVPKNIYFVNELPRNGANKLMRRELIQLLKEDKK